MHFHNVTKVMDLKKYIIDVHDFPEKGVIFRDITPLLSDSRVLAYVLKKMAKPFREEGIDIVASIESRGFILGAPLALKLKAGFVPLRKKGKLPRKVISQKLIKEYGRDIIEAHLDALSPGQKVLLVDDVLATGGTIESAIRLVEKMQGRLAGVAFLISLTYLPGMSRLKKILPPRTLVHSLIEY